MVSNSQRILFAMIILFIIFLPSIKAVESEYIFEVGQDTDLKVPCFDEKNALCANTTSCYITVNYPNGSNIIRKEAMTYNDAYYNYTLTGSILNIRGEYATTVNCEGAYNGFVMFNFKLTLDGLEEPSQNNIFAIVIGFVIIIVVFGVMGYSTEKLGVKMIGYGVALIELVNMIFIIYINETRQLLNSSLRVNFYIILILAFGIGIVFLISFVGRLMNPFDDASEGEGQPKWQKR